MSASKKAQKQQGKRRDSDSEGEDESSATGTEFGATGEKIEFADHNDPNLLKLLQQKLGFNANPSGFFDALPTQIKNRVYVLKNLHEERRVLETDFKKEYEALQQKYRTLYQPLYDERARVVAGAVEPSADQIASAKNKVEEKRREKAAAEGEQHVASAEQPAVTHTVQDTNKGIPDFWLTALKSHVDLRELVEPDDEAALRHLTDIRWHPLPENPVSFVLEFHFTPNEFFEETLLAKTYHMQENADSGDLHFSRVDSPTITWKAGKNLCVKQVTKQQKKKGGRRGKGAAPTRSITVEEPVNSFFHFFNPEAFLNLQPDLEVSVASPL